MPTPQNLKDAQAQSAAAAAASRAQQLTQLEQLASDLRVAAAPDAPSERLATCILLLQAELSQHANPGGGATEPAAAKKVGTFDFERGTFTFATLPEDPLALRWVETTGSAIADGSTLTVEMDKSGAASNQRGGQAGWIVATGRGGWHRGVNNGIVSFKFRIKASKLADGGRMKIGIVSRGADGKMQTVFVLKPNNGFLSEYPHGMPEGQQGKSGEKVMSGGMSGGNNKGALGALIEVRCDTLERTFSFQVTDGKGSRHNWYTATMRKRPIALPATFAPYVRAVKDGDAVELVAISHYLPGEIIREQLGAPPLGVDVAALSSALEMPDPSVKEEELGRARALLAEARAVQQAAREGASCPFYFLDAEALRRGEAPSSEEQMPLLLSMQVIQRRHPSWLVVEAVSLSDACRRARATDVVAVSHRWDEPSSPDPSGVQLGAIRAHLRAHPQVKRVWLDYCCMPQGHARTESEQLAFGLMLRNINLLYLGCSVLLLADRSYLSRFWTQFEAWLSMQSATASGLVSAPAEQRRYTIACVHGAPEALQASLVEEWSDCTAAKAHAKLSSKDVQVTNASDKATQLPKLLALDGKVSEAAGRLGAADEPPVLVAAPDNK